MDIIFLDDFIKQSQTTNLKTKGLYPSQILDLDVKVSFGMGTASHVPWIALLGPGMSTSNGFYPVYLFYKKENILILSCGVSETIPFEKPWTTEIITSNVKINEYLENPWRYGDSFVYKIYQQQISDNKVTYFSEEKKSVL